MMLNTSQQKVSGKILTVPNFISLIRLCLVPLFLFFLFNENNIAACVIFSVSAGTDWIDGQIARRTNQVSKLGQVLDPTVDRILVISAVVGLLLVGRVPVWIVVVILLRDLLLMFGGFVLLRKYKIRVSVIFVGKCAASLIYIGFAGLILNMPFIPGLGIFEVPWLPGFNSLPVCWGMWLIYSGMFINVFTTTHYICSAMKQLKDCL